MQTITTTTSVTGSTGRTPARTRRHGVPVARPIVDRRDPCRRQPTRRHAGRSADPAGRRIGAAPPVAARSRRRAVAGILLAVVVACGLVLAHDVLADPSGVPASAASGRPASLGSSLGSAVTARPGDSLWTIAERHHGEVPIARYVDELVDLNGGPGIQAGQAVLLP